MSLNSQNEETKFHQKLKIINQEFKRKMEYAIKPMYCFPKEEYEAWRNREVAYDSSELSFTI